MIGMLISLMMDWSVANGQDSNYLPVIYKSVQGFMTNIVAVAAFTIYAILLRREQNTGTYLAGFKNNIAATLMIMISAVLLYLTCIFGANLYFYDYKNPAVPNTWHQLITYLFTLIMLRLIIRFGLTVKVLFQLLLIAGCIAFYLFSIPNVTGLRNGVLQDQYPTIQLWIHWLSSLILLYLFYQSIDLYRNNQSAFTKTGRLFTWLITITLIAYFSVESMHAYTYLTAPLQEIITSLHQYSKAGLTIVWSLCSFMIMWLGMKHNYKTLRIISLLLFSVALLKLFLFDIRNISEGGKIAAFIMLGILLLIISFMYQKLKKIIIDDTAR